MYILETMEVIDLKNNISTHKIVGCQYFTDEESRKAEDIYQMAQKYWKDNVSSVDVRLLYVSDEEVIKND